MSSVAAVWYIMYFFRRCNHQNLEEIIKDMQRDVQKQLAERKSTDSPLNQIELVLNMS